MTGNDQLSREMYQEHILDLYKNPLNYGALANHTHEHRSHNPLCGDDLTIQVIVKSGKVADIKFSGKGCAISMASASLLTENSKGLSVKAIAQFDAKVVLDLLQIPIGPVRIKCALLSLEALKAAVA